MAGSSAKKGDPAGGIGGETRAALYTQSVLHGLREMDALKDLVLASGVSGGGVALAYFAARKEEFQKGGKEVWDDMPAT